MIGCIAVALDIGCSFGRPETIVWSLQSTGGSVHNFPSTAHTPPLPERVHSGRYSQRRTVRL
jgi:hypothetical protein